MKTQNETCCESTGSGAVLQGEKEVKICPTIKSGDIITIELDLNRLAYGYLSLGVKDDWYGVVTSFIAYGHGKYRLYVTILEPGITVETMDLYEGKNDI